MADPVIARGSNGERDGHEGEERRAAPGQAPEENAPGNQWLGFALVHHPQNIGDLATCRSPWVAPDSLPKWRVFSRLALARALLIGDGTGAVMKKAIATIL